MRLRWASVQKYEQERGLAAKPEVFTRCVCIVTKFTNVTYVAGLWGEAACCLPGHDSRSGANTLAQGLSRYAEQLRCGPLVAVR